MRHFETVHAARGAVVNLERLLPSQIEGIRALRSEAFRLGALLDVELEGLKPRGADRRMLRAELCALGIALQGPVEFGDLLGVESWAAAELDAMTEEVAREYGDPLRQLRDEAAGLRRWILGEL